MRIFFSYDAQRKLAYCLYGVAFLVFSMVLLGGFVRLTGSGLSMVDWKPIMGFLPPLSATKWQQVFQQYQLFPEFIIINNDMTLSQFKFIYWMEYTHRLLGRILGISYFATFFYFATRYLIPSKLFFHLFIILILGGLQGFLGWYMVQSGLIDSPVVSPYRLTAHLMIAIFIYLYLLKVAYTLLARSYQINKFLPTKSTLTAVLIMIASGGFVAGTKAGFIYNTFPKMGEDWVPSFIFSLSIWNRHIFENAALMQLLHRLLALVVWFFVLRLSYQLWFTIEPSAKTQAKTLLFALILQTSIGILTLMLKVPTWLGVFHQAGALILLTVISQLHFKYNTRRF